MENSSNKIVTVLSSNILFELEIAKGKLESERIESFIADQNMSTIGFIENFRFQIRPYDVLKNQCYS